MTDTQASPASANPSGAQDTSPPSNPSDTSHQLDSLIASIRAAVAPHASAHVRAIGAAACRAILTVLEAQVGQPLTAAASALTAAPSPPATPTSPLAGLISQLASMPRDQLLDALIARLRAALPPGTPITPPTGAPRFHLIQIPQLRPPGGGS